MRRVWTWWLCRRCYWCWCLCSWYSGYCSVETLASHIKHLKITNTKSQLKSLVWWNGSLEKQLLNSPVGKPYHRAKQTYPESFSFATFHITFYPRPWSLSLNERVWFLMIQDLLRSRHGEDEFTTEVCRNRSQWRVAGAESHCTETVQLLYTLYSATASVQLNCTFRRIKSLSSESRHIIIIYTLTLWHKIPICREVQYNKAVSDIQEYNRSHGYVDCFSPSFHKT